jgi:hypothetical protein
VFCNSLSNGSPWTPVDKTLVASTIILTVSALALGIIFYAANPLVNLQYMALVYADASLGGLAILGLACRYTFQTLQKQSQPPEFRCIKTRADIFCKKHTCLKYGK